MLEIRQDLTPALLDDLRALLREYAAIPGIEVCVQSFESEMAGLPGGYAAPAGRLLVAYHDGRAAGCVGLKDAGEGACEMKRLYVRPAFRGTGAGRALARALIEEARGAGYTRMRLETLPQIMREAVSLYESLGFRRVPAESGRPDSRILVMEMPLIGSF